MLVLSRKAGETICVGNDINVLVLSVRHHRVRLGIDAPRAISVHRAEVYEAIQREEQAARTPIQSGFRVRRFGH